MNQGLLRVCLVYFALTGVIAVAILLDVNHAVTPDSDWYQFFARRFAQVESPFPPSMALRGYTATWPLGYAWTTGIVMRLTGLSALWASKLVNVLALAGAVALLYRRYQRRAWVLALAFCPLVKIYCYTGSEPLYLFFLLLFAVMAERLLVKFTPKACLIFGLAALGAFLTRYIGGFTFGLVLGLATVFFIRQQRREGGILMGLFVVLMALAGGYFELNYWQSGTYSGGGARLMPELEPFRPYIQRVIRTLADEFFLIRDWSPNGFNSLFLLGFLIEILTLSWLVLGLRRVSVLPNLPLDGKIYFVLGTVYLFTFGGLHRLMPFAEMTSRTWAPTTLFYLLTALSWLSQPALSSSWKTIRIPLSILFMFSLLLSPLPPDFPKKYLLRN